MVRRRRESRKESNVQTSDKGERRCAGNFLSLLDMKSFDGKGRLEELAESNIRAEYVALWSFPDKNTAVIMGRRKIEV